MLPLSVPSKVLGAVIGRVRVGVWWWPSLSRTGSAVCLTHPRPGAERDQRGPGNTVGGYLSALGWAADPWEGETPGLTSPDCARPERRTAVSRGWCWKPTARSPERPRAYPVWADLRRGIERGTPRGGCAHPESVSVPVRARPSLALNSEQGCEGYSLLLTNFLSLSCVCLFCTAQGTLWGPAITRICCNFGYFTCELNTMIFTLKTGIARYKDEW